MKFYFTWKNNNKMETISEPFFDHHANEMRFLARNFRTARVSIMRLSDIDGEIVYTDHELFNKVNGL